MRFNLFFNACYEHVVRPYWIWLTLFILFVISFLSLLPLGELPEVAGSDKLHHFVAYAGLFFFVALRKPKFWWVLMLVFIAWGGAIELIQPYMNRYAEWLDFLVNALGVLFGALVGFWCRKVFSLT
ncbi:MAG: hypothetical protein L3J00_00935 [Thiomicrorhabdus sp.]|nr:hypothetical protein [Thiomicrorhabdus sp.]